jgi:phosphoglucomutase
MEGGEGARKIAALVESYSTNPPKEIDGSAATAVKDYAKGGFYDQEGDEIPEAAMLFVDLADGRRFAVRPSGTEPKIKYYLFGKGESKETVEASLDSLWTSLKKDAYERMG